MSNASYTAPPVVDRIQQRSLVIGVAGLVLLAIGAIISREQFFRSYLIGYMFWLGITLGCLAIVMLQHLTGGAWGLVIRRVLESATRVLPVMAILFLPLVGGMHSLYEWTHYAEVAPAEHASGSFKGFYLSVPFFLARAAFYFAVWAVLTYYFNKWSREQDETANPKLTRRFEALSAPGLILYGLTVTFASIDWVMSLNSEWYSTIYGMLFMAGQALSAMSFAIAMAVLLAGREPMSKVYLPTHFHDLGKLLLALVMIWAYLSFSQLLIIWSGNLPEEITFYVRRLQSNWKWVGLILIAFHFVLPFALLLSRDLKRHARALYWVAILIMVLRVIDLFWLVAPEQRIGQQVGIRISWMDVVAPIGLGGIWLAAFMRQLKKRPLVPIHDPYLEHALGH
jgi:hypothetical protein